MRGQDALIARAKWIAYCIRIKFATKDQIPELEKIWDKFKDNKGNLKKAS